MLGDKIREARKKASLTQAELAEKIGVKRSVISKYENGSISPTYDNIKKIADALHVRVYQFYDDASWLDKNTDYFEDITKLFSLIKFLKEDPKSPPSVPGIIEAFIPNFDEMYENFPRQTGDIVSASYDALINSDFVNAILPSIEKLNGQGLKVAQERIKELAEIPKYCKGKTESIPHDNSAK